MTTDIQKYDPKNEILLKDDIILSKNEIKKHYAPGATDDELAVFIMTANAFNLNPIKREIHFVKYGDGPGKCVIGYQSYIKRAEETGRLKGYEVIYEGDPPRSVCRVIIHRKDWAVPFTWETTYEEVAFAHKKDGTRYPKSSGFKSQPKFMHKKTTICQAFRLAFPTELGGMPYEESELPHGEPVKAEYTVENGLPHIKTVDDEDDMPFRDDETPLSRLELFLQAHFYHDKKALKEMLKMAFGTTSWTKIKKLPEAELIEGYEKIKACLDGEPIDADQPAVEESGSGEDTNASGAPPSPDPDVLKLLGALGAKAKCTAEDVELALEKSNYPTDKDPAKINGNLDKDEFKVAVQKVHTWFFRKELDK